MFGVKLHLVYVHTLAREPFRERPERHELCLHVQGHHISRSDAPLTAGATYRVGAVKP